MKNKKHNNTIFFIVTSILIILLLFICIGCGSDTAIIPTPGTEDNVNNSLDSTQLNMFTNEEILSNKKPKHAVLSSAFYRFQTDELMQQKQVAPEVTESFEKEAAQEVFKYILDKVIGSLTESEQGKEFYEIMNELRDISYQLDEIQTELDNIDKTIIREAADIEQMINSEFVQDYESNIGYYYDGGDANNGTASDFLFYVSQSNSIIQHIPHLKDIDPNHIDFNNLDPKTFDQYYINHYNLNPDDPNNIDPNNIYIHYLGPNGYSLYNLKKLAEENYYGGPESEEMLNKVSENSYKLNITIKNGSLLTFAKAVILNYTGEAEPEDVMKAYIALENFFLRFIHYQFEALAIVTNCYNMKDSSGALANTYKNTIKTFITEEINIYIKTVDYFIVNLIDYRTPDAYAFDATNSFLASEFYDSYDGRYLRVANDSVYRNVIARSRFVCTQILSNLSDNPNSLQGIYSTCITTSDYYPAGETGNIFTDTNTIIQTNIKSRYPCSLWNVDELSVEPGYTWSFYENHIPVEDAGFFGGTIKYYDPNSYTAAPAPDDTHTFGFNCYSYVWRWGKSIFNGDAKWYFPDSVNIIYPLVYAWPYQYDQLIINKNPVFQVDSSGQLTTGIFYPDPNITPVEAFIEFNMKANLPPDMDSKHNPYAWIEIHMDNINVKEPNAAIYSYTGNNITSYNTNPLNEVYGAQYTAYVKFVNTQNNAQLLLYDIDLNNYDDGNIESDKMTNHSVGVDGKHNSWPTGGVPVTKLNSNQITSSGNYNVEMALGCVGGKTVPKDAYQGDIFWNDTFEFNSNMSLGSYIQIIFTDTKEELPDLQ